jgi:hypothetical protein
VDFVAMAVDQKGFLSIDGVPWQGAVRKPGSSWFLDDVYNLYWFHNGEAQHARSYDDTFARRYRPERVHDKPTRCSYLPMEHFVSHTLPDRVTAPDEAGHFRASVFVVAGRP